MKSWFETNGYNVRETNDIYDAFEEMTDITLELRPSMILLNSYLSSQDCSWVMSSLHQFVAEHDIPFVYLSAQDEKNNPLNTDEYFAQVENFDSLKPLMQTLVPVYSQARAAA
ncbi:MAG: hypothetical protein ABI954_04880 [Pyrinomonadaceae bacterium]